MRQLTPGRAAAGGGLSRRYGFGTDAVTAMLESVARRRRHGAVRPPRVRRHGPVVARRDDDDRRHVQHRAEGPRRGLCADLAGALGGELLAPAQGAAERRPSARGRARARAGPAAASRGAACSSPEQGPAAAGRRSWAIPPPPDRRTTSATRCFPARGGSPSNGRRAHRLRHPRPPDRRRLAAAERRRLANLHQPARAGAPGRSARRFGRRRGRETGCETGGGRGERLRRPRAGCRTLPPGRNGRSLAHRRRRRTSLPWRAPPPPESAPGSADDILGKIERLAALRDRGILSEDEFSAKKGELLARL